MIVPLHVLFTEQGNISPETWISWWQNEKAEVSRGISIGVGIDEAERVLNGHCVYVVARRVVDGVDILYTSVRMSDGSVMLSEIRFGSGEISTKGGGGAVGELARCIEGILKEL
jgi:hypothetical protein